MSLRSMWLLPVCLITVQSLDLKQQTMFQNVIDTASHLSHQAGISMGVAFPGETLSFATGLKDRERAAQLKPQDRMGIGSATKSMTATAVLKLVEAGQLGLDSPALPHMDALIRKVTSKSLVDYLGPNIRNVTVRHLLHMTSGIGDFDSRDLRVYAYAHPQEEADIGKVLGEFMQRANVERVKLLQKTDPTDAFTCAPGTCGEYSSTNYLLLGMLLAQSHGHQHWMQYDQASFLPADVRQKMPSTLFPLQGNLREFTDVHSYSDGKAYKGSPLEKDGVIDSIDMNANTGFTVANALSTGSDMAAFMHALLGKQARILNPNTRAEMMKLRWLETGLGNKVSVGQFYGMGVRDMSGQLILNPVKAVFNPEIFFAGLLYGHDGASAAAYNSLSVYAPKYDFGMSFIINDFAAATFWNFMSRKLYDLASGMTSPVPNPLKAQLENADAFMSQPWIQQVRTVRT